MRNRPVGLYVQPQDGSETDLESSSSASSARRISLSNSPNRQNESPLSRAMSDSPSPRHNSVPFNYEETDQLPKSPFPQYSNDDLFSVLDTAPLFPTTEPTDVLPTINTNNHPGYSQPPEYGPADNSFNMYSSVVSKESELQNVSESLSDSYVYRVDHFKDLVNSKRSEKLTSQPFEIDGFRWQILFFPMGNSNNRYNPQNVSMFVQLVDTHNYPPNTQHKFKFTVIPPDGSSQKPHMKESQHRFTASENDRGFSELIPISSALLYVHPPNDSLVIKVELTRSKLPSNNYFWPDATYDSKAVTGFVGLKNQGATCYMNSLLQTLFHLPPFRQLIYSLPTDTDQASRVPLSLQRVFYNLQTSDTAPSTKQLTSAFGWNSLEAFMQHDVQEFSRVLLDNLDELLKKTPLEGRIEQMFAGKVEMFIECVNVQYKSQRTEPYFDLALNVKGCQTLAKSFEQYCEVEMLDGDNKYRAEQHGLQDARKGVRFLSFPPVLQLQLKRFEYNFERDMNVKLNDRFEFPLTIDLTSYVSSTVDPAPASDPHIYHLHSVLVHSGSGHGGHYYSFIRPFFSKLEYSKSPWFKFDDEHVTTATTEEATVGNFGGETRAGYYPITRVSMANAYMLVYIRQRVTQEITQVVPEKLREMKEGDMANGEVHPHSIVNPVVRSEGEVSLPVKAELDAALLAQQPPVFVDSKDALDDVTMPEISPPSDSENADDEKMPPLIDDVTDVKLPDDDFDPRSLTPIDVPVPETLLQLFNREDEVAREKKARQAREYLNTELVLVSDQQLVEQSMNGIGIGWELNVMSAPVQPAGEEPDISESQIQAIRPCHKVRALRTHTIAEAAAVLSQPRAEGEEVAFEWDELFGIPHDRQQFWFVNSIRKGSEPRPVLLLMNDAPTRVDQMRDGVFVRDRSIDFVPEIAALTGNAGADLTPDRFSQGGDRSLILCKAFDIVQQRAVYLGSVIVPTTMSFANMEPLFRVLMTKRGFTLSSIPNEVMEQVHARSGSDIMQEDVESRLVFAEERNGVVGTLFDVEELDPLAPTVAHAGIQTGNIIVAQLDLQSDVLLALEEHQMENNSSAGLTHVFQPSYLDYIQYLQSRMLVELRVLANGPLSKVSMTRRIELINTMKYEQVVARIADALSLDPSRVSLHKAHPVNRNQPEDKPVTESWQYKPKDRIEWLFDSSEPVIYVNVLEHTAAELLHHMPLRIVYIEKDGRDHSFKTLVPRGGCVRDVVIAARRYMIEHQLIKEFTSKLDDVFVYTESPPPTDFIEGPLDESLNEFLSVFRGYNNSQRSVPEVIVQEMFDGLPEARQLVNDQTLSDDATNPNAPALRMVSHYFNSITAPNVYRAYSHIFPIVVPQNATADVILKSIWERLRIDDPERRAQCKLAWFMDSHGRDIDLGSDFEVLNNAPTSPARLGFHDPVHFREYQATMRARADVMKPAAVPYQAYRTNNTAIKFYS